MNLNVESLLSPGTLNDLKRSLNFIPKGRSLRLVRIPALDFSVVMEKALVNNKYLPFRPVVFDNIPIDMTESLLPECILVADDNTNVSRIITKETEFYKPEAI